MTKSKLDRNIKNIFVMISLKKRVQKKMVYTQKNKTFMTKFIAAIPENIKEQLRELWQNVEQPVIRQLQGDSLENYLTPLEKEGFSSLRRSILIGTLLGNATLHYGLKKKAYLKFEQKQFEPREFEDQSYEYIFFLYSVFSSITGTPPSPRLKKGKLESYCFCTYEFMPLYYYFHEFYHIDALGNKQKRVPRFIHQWLNPIVLAFWFMEDGSISDRGIHLRTKGLLFSDIEILQKAIGSVFHLETTITSETKKETGKTYHRLFIALKDNAKFMNIVMPYMLPCKMYLLNLSEIAKQSLLLEYEIE